MMLPGMVTENDRRAAETDTRERGDDPTPRELVRAIIEAAAGALDMERFAYLNGDQARVLDVCAGYGCWASEWRSWWNRSMPGWPLEIMGVEICEARRDHLRKWCDQVIVDHWRALNGASFDIAIGNPDFKLLLAEDGDPEQSMPAVLLRHAHAVLLLHQTTNFQRGRAGVAAWRAHSPARVWLVPGSVGFRGPGTQTDSRCYQASLWLRDHAGPTITEMLPSPTDGGASWRWTVPPGSEDPSDDLPASPGWRP